MGKNSNSGNDGTMRLVRFLLLALLLLPRGILGTIMLPEFNRSFKSMPAIFGQRLDIDDPVSLAHLQLIKELPLLCEEEKGLNNSAAESDVVTPSHGLPVALLVQRGSCTFMKRPNWRCCGTPCSMLSSTTMKSARSWYPYQANIPRT
jgi:hypothetical protein